MPDLFRISISFAAVVFLVCGSSSAQAFVDHCWTAVPSAGVVDEADNSLVVFDLNSAAVRLAKSAGTVDLHYSVVAVEGLFGGINKILIARFADNGPDARVIVKVRRTNIFTGVTSTHVTIDSDEFPPIGPQTVTKAFGALNGGAEFFNFRDYVYWVDAQLIKSNTGGNPRLEALNVCTAYR